LPFKEATGVGLSLQANAHAQNPYNIAVHKPFKVVSMWEGRCPMEMRNCEFQQVLIISKNLA